MFWTIQVKWFVLEIRQIWELLDLQTLNLSGNLTHFGLLDLSGIQTIGNKTNMEIHKLWNERLKWKINDRNKTNMETQICKP